MAKKRLNVNTINHSAKSSFNKVILRILESLAMLAEMLQKYLFIFNVFLSKKLYIFTFNEKNIFVL